MIRKAGLVFERSCSNARKRATGDSISTNQTTEVAPAAVEVPAARSLRRRAGFHCRQTWPAARPSSQPWLLASLPLTDALAVAVGFASACCGVGWLRSAGWRRPDFGAGVAGVGSCYQVRPRATRSIMLPELGWLCRCWRTDFRTGRWWRCPSWFCGAKATVPGREARRRARRAVGAGSLACAACGARKRYGRCEQSGGIRIGGLQGGLEDRTPSSLVRIDGRRAAADELGHLVSSRCCFSLTAATRSSLTETGHLPAGVNLPSFRRT